VVISRRRGEAAQLEPGEPDFAVSPGGDAGAEAVGEVGAGQADRLADGLSVDLERDGLAVVADDEIVGHADGGRELRHGLADAPVIHRVVVAVDLDNVPGLGVVADEQRARAAGVVVGPYDELEMAGDLEGVVLGEEGAGPCDDRLLVRPAADLR